MKILFLVFTLLLSTGIKCFSQHLIGVDKSMITTVVRKEMKGFHIDNSAKNQKFNYLKFVNSAGTKTLIVFFDDRNISSATRLICEFSELNFLLPQLNNAYKKTAENSWEYAVNSENFEVTLEKKEWYFVINTKKK